MTSRSYLLVPNQRCYFAQILLRLLFCFAPAFAGTAFAQAPDFDNLAKQLSRTLREAQVHTIIVSDFVSDGGRLTLQGVLLADKLWFALLEQQKGFQTLNRNLLHKQLHTQLRSNDSFQKTEVEAAHAVGAEVIVIANIEQQSKNLNISIIALDVSTGQEIEQWTVAIPRTQALDELAGQNIQPDGPVYLDSQNGVSMPACVYCPNPQYTEEAKKKKLEGKVVLAAVIAPSGRAEKIWEVRGLSDGLTEQAIKVVRQWRFKPAQDSQGNTVTVMVHWTLPFASCKQPSAFLCSRVRAGLAGF